MSAPTRRRPGEQSALAFVLPVEVESVRTPAQPEEPTPPATAPSPVAAATVEAKPPTTPRKPQQGSRDRTPSPAVDEDAGKIAVTFSIRTALKKRAEMAVLTTAAHPGGHRSLAGLLEAAIERELERLAKEFNDGEPFKPNAGGFRQGRPFSQ